MKTKLVTVGLAVLAIAVLNRVPQARALINGA